MSSKPSSPASRRPAKGTALPSRPNLEQLRTQSKQLLARLRGGDTDAAREFIAHLPEASGLTPARALKADYRLADAQSVVARRSGFASWPALSRHVALLRALEGTWGFASLEVDGQTIPATMLGASRILIDGDRFRTESPEATYDGEFLIDVEASPCTIDIAFVEGPEAGNTAHGIFTLDGDTLTICLGLVGASRPTAFHTTAGSQHALETLHRASAARPVGVTGGAPHNAKRAPATDASASSAGAQHTSSVSTAAQGTADAEQFVVTPCALDAALLGEWAPLELVRDGKPLPSSWLAAGRRMATTEDVKVIFGGQVMVHVKVRHDDRHTPAHVDYLHLTGEAQGHVTHGILELRGNELWVNMAPPGAARPTDWISEPGSGRSFSRWKKR